MNTFLRLDTASPASPMRAPLRSGHVRSSSNVSTDGYARPTSTHPHPPPLPSAPKLPKSKLVSPPPPSRWWATEYPTRIYPRPLPRRHAPPTAVGARSVQQQRLNGRVRTPTPTSTNHRTDAAPELPKRLLTFVSQSLSQEQPPPLHDDATPPTGSKPRSSVYGTSALRRSTPPPHDSTEISFRLTVGQHLPTFTSLFLLFPPFPHISCLLSHLPSLCFPLTPLPPLLSAHPVPLSSSLLYLISLPSPSLPFPLSPPSLLFPRPPPSSLSPLPPLTFLRSRHPRTPAG